MTFAAWEDHGERYRRRDAHEHEVWATDASCARRLAAEQVQAVPDYRPNWRIRRVVCPPGAVAGAPTRARDIP